MTMKKVLIMVGNDVVTDLNFDDHFLHNKYMHEAFKNSKIRIIEVGMDSDVSFYDKYDGNSFIKNENKPCTCHRCNKKI